MDGRPPPVKPRRRVGRPSDPGKAQAILDAGWTLFLARGVEATPIEAIASRAGVSKVTLYRHFPDKAALFEAAVLREMARIETAQREGGAHASDAPIAARLEAFGLGVMTFLASPPAVDFYNVVAGELRRHPGLARAFYDAGPGRTRANLTALIEDGVRRGQLRDVDPAQAADELFGLWQGFTNFQHALDIDAATLRRESPVRVARGVTQFLRLYGGDEGL